MGIISYDFDGVLHTSVVGIHPIDRLNHRSWEPDYEMFDKMFEDAEDHRIIVVTARMGSPLEKVSMMRFIGDHNLPVEDIIFTKGRPKRPFLEKLGVIRHYDDNKAMIKQMKGSDCAFVLVESNEWKDGLTERDIRVGAWAHLLSLYRKTGLKLSEWKGDNRMGILFDDVLNEITDDIRDGVAFADKKTSEMTHRVFGTDSIYDALKLSKEYKKYDTPGYSGYPISRVPIDFYLSVINPEMGESFDEIEELCTEWFNHERQSTIREMKKNPHIKDWNRYKWYIAFGETQKVEVYRGMKSEPMEDGKKFDSWSYVREQAVRFATYHFTGGMQFRPIYSEEGYVLTTEITLGDVVVFVGMDESEIILKNSVEYHTEKIK